MPSINGKYSGGKNARVYWIIAISIVYCTLLSANLKITGSDYALYILLLLFAGGSLFKRFAANNRIAAIFLIYTAFLLVNAFRSPYVVNIQWACVGIALNLLLPASVVLFDKAQIQFGQIARILRLVVYIAVLLCIGMYIEAARLGNGLILRGVSSLFKDGGLASTFLNISLAASLCLYRETKHRRYFSAVILFLISILSLQYLKSVLLMSAIVGLYLWSAGATKKVLYSATLFTLIGIFAAAGFFDKILGKVETYRVLYAASENMAETPRNALYIAAVDIANKNFPFGAGSSTFGSLPVIRIYNPIYYEYGLNRVYGLSEDEGQSAHNFLLDTYWSSVLGELGYIGIILFLYFFFHPLRKISKISLKSSSLVFFIYATTFAIFIESFALAIGNQISFIVAIAIINNLLATHLVQMRIRTNV